LSKNYFFLLFNHLTNQRINHLYPLPTIRTKFEIDSDIFATRFAGLGPFLLPIEVRPKLINAAFTAIAHNKRFALFDSEKRYEKEAEVMIHALIIRLMQTANRASAGILIKNFDFGRNTGNKDHS
jgi:hypothetical protein